MGEGIKRGYHQLNVGDLAQAWLSGVFQIDVNTGELLLASYLIYAQALLEYVIFIMRVRSVTKMLPSVKFAEDKVLTFLILREKAKMCNSES